MKLAQAETIARSLVDLLAPGCTQIEIAGSVRRRKPEPKDLELVAIADAIVTTDLLGLERIDSYLEVRIAGLVAQGTLVFDSVVKRNGPRAKRLIYEGLVVDLFIAVPNNYGNTLAIRTGDADFSRQLVTPRRQGGLMPGNLRQHDGFLWAGHDRIDCPTEESFFTALGIDWVEPASRTLATAQRLARQVMKVNA